MSGSRDEGALLGGVRPQAQPPGRGLFVERRTGARLIQTALAGDAGTTAGGPDATGRAPVAPSWIAASTPAGDGKDRETRRPLAGADDPGA